MAGHRSRISTEAGARYTKRAKVSSSLERQYEVIQDHILDSEFVGGDETSWKVMGLPYGVWGYGLQGWRIVQHAEGARLRRGQGHAA